MQYWITILNLSGWKAHFITLQPEFFNFLSLASGKLECFAILAVGWDINLKKPSVVEGGTMGCLAFALVSPHFRHSRSSSAFFSWVQNLAEVNSISLLHWLFMSHQHWFLCPHFSPSLSASPLWHLLYQLCLLLLARVAKSSRLWHTEQGAGTQLRGKKAVANLGASIQTSWSPPSLPGAQHLSPQREEKSRRIKILYMGKGHRYQYRAVSCGGWVPQLCKQKMLLWQCYHRSWGNIRISLLMSTDIPWPNMRVPASQVQCQTNDLFLLAEEHW